ncbi:MAG: glycosyltransferase [Betaproteobacteria bacterium]|nr:MAG: glycosyltransferase [Betaproteobacteria bacterium]
MKISVAMATFNGAQYLPEQLDSILRQELLPHELVVCDDSSTDETCQIIEHFANQAPFEVRLVRNIRPLQSTANFNQALSLCSGDLVFLSDQDDVWLEQKISTLSSLARSDPTNHVFMNDAEIVTDSLQRTGLTKLGQLHSAGISERKYVMGCTAAIRGAFLKQVLPVPEAYRGHDSWIIQIAEGLGVRRIVRESLQLYRRHGGNVSQFVANQTVRVGRLAYLLNRVSDSFSRDDSVDLAARLAETRAMRQRVLEMSDSGLIREVSSAAGWQVSGIDPDPVAVSVARKRGLDAQLEGIDGTNLASTLPPTAMRDSGALADLGPEKFEVFLERLKALEDAIQSRALCLEKAGVGRLGSVIRLYWQGKYRQFGGLESAFRDLLVK